MKLHIKNIAKIKETEILVDGITVIAGKNNTGKSTVGKVLFCLFDTLYNFDNKIVKQRDLHVDSAISNLYFSAMAANYMGEDRAIARDTLTSLVSSIMLKYKENKSLSVQDMMSLFEREKSKSNNLEALEAFEEKYRQTADDVATYLAVPEARVAQEILEEEFGSVFHGQINSMEAPDAPCEVAVTIKGETNTISFAKNACKKNDINIKLQNQAIFIDDPLVLDRLGNRGGIGRLYGIYTEYRNIWEARLIELLSSDGDSQPATNAVERIVNKDRLAEIQKLIGQAIGESNVVYDEGYKLREDGTSYNVDFANLSYGLRTFIAIKVLLERNVIHDRDVLILDEPEIHLHPQWQVLFAHVIVLLQKEFNLSVVLTTHSHFFVDAINLYSRKYETSGNVHYYLSGLEDNRAIISEVSPNNLEDIYQMMAVAVEELEILRSQLEDHDDED